MRRGGLTQVLHHALDPSLFHKFTLKSTISPPLLNFRTWHRSVDHLCNQSLSTAFSLVPAASRPQTSFANRGGNGPGSEISLHLTRKLSRGLNRCARDLESASYMSQSETPAAVMEGPPEGYRPNVGLCLVNDKDEVFVASRLDVPESWQMPQGGVDDGEEPRNAAIRELREETGVTSAELVGEVHEWLTYDFPPVVKERITRLWGKAWRGQAQKWFLFRFKGDDSEVNLAGDGTEPPEFGNWKWLPASEVLNLAVEFKKPVYIRAFKSLSTYVEAWAKL